MNDRDWCDVQVDTAKTGDWQPKSIKNSVVRQENMTESGQPGQLWLQD